MVKKINWLLAIGLLVYSRFMNLGWGLPYPMHPDERNMAVAVQGLTAADWFDPHFFAYGQFPLSLGNVIVSFLKLDPTLSLRVVEATASVINAFILFKIINLFYSPISNIKNKKSK